MARPRTATVYESGPVRVTAARSGYRLRWMELGVERERSVSTRADAERTADAIAGRLALAGAGGVSGATAYGALADAWVERYRSDWGPGHMMNVTSVLDGHILPAVGRMSCDRVTDADLNGVSVAMLEAGYSTDWRAHTVRTMRSLGRWGVSRGVWVPLTDPAAGLKVPSSGDRGVDKTLIPSAALIEELGAAVVAQAPNADQALRRRWMLAAASGTGLRFSELTALWPEHVDLATREVRVVQAWVRQASGPPVLGPPKSTGGRRTVVIPADDVALWAEVLKATEGRQHMGTSLRGAVWRSSGWKQRVWDNAVADVEGWPARAGLHYLRHAAIVSWLERGMPIGNVSRMAGHASPDFTMARYVGAGTDHLDQARNLLQGWASGAHGGNPTVRPMPIAFPIARYWRLVVPPVPRRLTIRRDGDSAVVMADGREVGFLHPYPVADWLQTLVQQVPHILASMEELATQRALYATALLAADPAAAKALSAQLGVPLDGCSDVLWGVGDAVELAAHTLIDDEGDREPPPD